MLQWVVALVLRVVGKAMQPSELEDMDECMYCIAKLPTVQYAKMGSRIPTERPNVEVDLSL